MVQYSVNHVGVDQVYADMRTQTQAVQTMITDLERTSESTLADWEGDARQAYWAAKQEWRSAATNMASLADRMAQNLNAINATYQGADRGAASTFR